MGSRVVAVLEDRVVGRYHGPHASHVAVVVLANGRVHCRGWGDQSDAEAALARAKRAGDLSYGAIHETEPDRNSRAPIVRRVAPRRPLGSSSPPSQGARR